MQPQDDPGSRALVPALFLSFVAGVLLVLLQTVPVEMPGLPVRAPGLPPAGYLVLAELQGTVAAAVLVFLPLAALPPDARRSTQRWARWAALAVAACLVLSVLPGVVVPARGLPALVATALLMVVPQLSLAATLALRLATSMARAVGLAAAGLAGGVAVAGVVEAGWPSVAGVLPLVAVVAGLALLCWRGGRLPAQTRPWLAALLAMWLVPLAADVLPGLVAAVSLPSPAGRLGALAGIAADWLPPRQVFNPAGTVLILAAMLGLRRAGPPPPGEVWCAVLLAGAVALSEGALRLGTMQMDPAKALDLLGAGEVSAADALAGVAVRSADVLAAPLMTLVAGLLFLRAPRPGA